jgi:hypothetical protein
MEFHAAIKHGLREKLETHYAIRLMDKIVLEP